MVFCRRKVLSASTAVMLPPSRHIVPCQEEVQFFVILLTVRLFLHEILEGGFHHGNFKYCFFRTEPSGYSHHRCHQCDMDDFEGCLSEQASGKALFQKTARKMTARCVQTSAVMFSSKM